MREALKQAQQAFDNDEVPVGAVILKDQQIIAKAYNQVETLKDPTAHAEMIAITQATHHLQSKWLPACTMYVTVEPCSMCAGALVLARIQKVVWGCDDPKTGACVSVLNIIHNNMLNHQVEILKGVLSEDASYLMSAFFHQKRLNTKMDRS
ncbi:MAG: tRNA adenosine(34) deaminase TadA [Candidatus Omnitrophica bacterium]|nr:tRNA adenosine(34) deaminase TadA [Candidatus Omnitrophota bacterium]